MTKILFQHEGDRSVGIDGDEATLTIDLAGMPEDQKKCIAEDIRKILEEVWDFPTFVEIAGEKCKHPRKSSSSGGWYCLDCPAMWNSKGKQIAG